MRRVGWFALICVLLVSSVATAGSFYIYDDNELYWIYEETKPGFNVLVPSGGVRYIETSRFGENLLELSISENGPMLTIGSISQAGVSVSTVRKAIVDYWNRLLTNVRVTNNEQITTSNGTAATFYALVGTAPTGQSVMVRIVLYQREKDIAYIVYTLQEKEYTGTIREYWIRAVNTFKWM